MPPRLLLDAHLSGDLADALGSHGIDATAAQKDSALREAADEALLIEACRQQRAVVTYNVRHFVPLARRWAHAERHHWGIILIHSRSIAQHDFGGQLNALVALLTPLEGEDALQDQTIYLAQRA